MLYNTDSMRRKERAMTETEARHLLSTCTHGTLCLQDTAGGGYGVPINYAWDGGNCLFLHGAPEGHKMQCLRENPRVSFIVTGNAGILAEQFSTAYESVIVQGIAEEVTDSAEKREALLLLIRTLTPHETDRGMQYIERAVNATTVLRIRITTYCGKAHRRHPDFAV